ncbi:hypothetical protein ACIQVR_41015 [Streptomyces xanthochromogenes]|uniref:hypothetical protein n=1 Tax=Streptomyces xanthochromogenes TaxID=67384 RepID=UPI0038006657
MTLAEVADAYEREAYVAIRHAVQDRLRRQARCLRRMVANRDAADPTTLRLHHALTLDVPGRWCRRHGYRASFGYDGLTLQREGEPVIVASVGNTLHWDGHRITVTP